MLTVLRDNSFMIDPFSHSGFLDSRFTAVVSFQLRPLVWRNWYHLSWLATIVAIGLWKPYAKSQSGTNLVMSMMFIDSLHCY
jgi:hypothetical protein